MLKVVYIFLSIFLSIVSLRPRYAERPADADRVRVRYLDPVGHNAAGGVYLGVGGGVGWAESCPLRKLLPDTGFTAAAANTHRGNRQSTNPYLVIYP